MTSSATPDFWRSFAELPRPVQDRARRVFRLWRQNPRHPSLCFKKVGTLWSVRIDEGHRALALAAEDALHWFWIGAHDAYGRLIVETR